MSARKPKATNESSSNRFFRLGQQLAASPTPEAFAWLALCSDAVRGWPALAAVQFPLLPHLPSAAESARQVRLSSTLKPLCETSVLLVLGTASK